MVERVAAFVFVAVALVLTVVALGSLGCGIVRGLDPTRTCP